MISFRQADLLEKLKPTPFKVTFAYQGYTLKFTGLVNESDENLGEKTLDRMKYLEDLIYEVWPGQREGDRLYRMWSPDGPTLASMRIEIAKLLEADPRVVKTYLPYNEEMNIIVDVI